MARLSKIARTNRIANNRQKVLDRLSHRIINTDKPGFVDLVSSKGKKMTGLNGAIILERDFREDGRLKGVISIDVDDLASILPDIKLDTEDKTGWAKHLAVFQADGVDILEGVDDSTPDEFELPATEELSGLDIPAMSDFEAKQKLIELQQRLLQES